MENLLSQFKYTRRFLQNQQAYLNQFYYPIGVLNYNIVNSIYGIQHFTILSLLYPHSKSTIIISK